jgi:hypothetical protein
MTSHNPGSQNVGSLFQTAKAEGNLSQRSIQALGIVDPGAQIQAGLGVSVGDVQSSEVIQVTFLIDDSGSISYGNNEDIVREGHNMVLTALGDSKQAACVIVSARALNRGVLYPYVALKDAVRLDASNYRGDGGTPLYDQSIVTLGQVVAKTQEFSDAGVSVRSVTAIITDGADEHSKSGSSHVKSIVEDMLRSENHVICAMGIDDHGKTDFREVFKNMGVRPEWILTPGNSPKEIRRAFQTISQSAVRMSQAAHFSKAALGGFGG